MKPSWISRYQLDFLDSILEPHQEPILYNKFSLKKSELVLNVLTVCYLTLDLTSVMLHLELRQYITKKLKTKFVFLRLKLFYRIDSRVCDVIHSKKQTQTISTWIIEGNIMRSDPIARII